jgi:translation initiation factor IF-3
LSNPFFSRSNRSREPLHRRNGKIRAREVRVIGDAKEQLGVMALGDALALARTKNLDLIEIAPNAIPPVCRIVNYGKFLYDKAKRSKDSHNSCGKLKELQISSAIPEASMNRRNGVGRGYWQILSPRRCGCVSLKFSYHRYTR